jgi:hypothetical protein
LRSLVIDSIVGGTQHVNDLIGGFRGTAVCPEPSEVDAGLCPGHYQRGDTAAPMSTRLLSVLAAALLNACGGGGSDETTLPFLTVASTRQSGFGSAEHVVLRSDTTLRELWARMTVDAAPAPSVDFAGLQMLGVFLGSQADGCPGVVISSVTRTEASLVVRYHETMPEPASMCNPATVSPAHFIAVAKSPLPVEFEAE